MYLVDETKPPQFTKYGVAYWERTSDPWHPDAFKGLDIPKDASLLAIGINKVADFLNQKEKPEPRKDGWMAIEWSENPIGFIPDGTEQQGEPPQVVIQMGPFGHMCAYDPADTERMANHQKQIEAKQKENQNGNQA